MPIIRKKRRNESASNVTISVVVFSVLCALGFLARTKSVDDLQLFFNTDGLQRSLRVDGVTSNLLHFRVPNATNPATESIINPDYGKYEPVNCRDLLELDRTNGKEVDPNEGILYGKQIEIEPKFWISLHKKEADVTRWHVMELGHYYERALTQAFIDVLKESPPGTRIVDVGGNIGFFTLLSAANGPVTIDTFEPNFRNRFRLCESLALNHWSREYDERGKKDHQQHLSQVNLYPLGIGRKEAVLAFWDHANPGQGVFTESAPGSHGLSGPGRDTGLPVTTLDRFARERGWFDSRPDIAILKIDIEGMEYTAIEGALELLRAKIVRNIFMEVSARTRGEERVNKPALRLLRESGYTLYKYGGWRGPSIDTDFPQDENIAEHIMKRCHPEPSKQLNLWWKLEP